MASGIPPIRPRGVERVLALAALLAGFTGLAFGLRGLGALADRDPVFAGATGWRLLELATLRFPAQLADSIPFGVTVAAAALPAAFGLAVLALLARSCRTPLASLAARWERDHVVVCGPGRHVAAIVRALRDTGHRVVVLQPGLPGFAGVVEIRGDPADPRALVAASAPRARATLALGDDDSANLDTGIAVRVACAPAKLAETEPVVCVIGVESDVVRDNAARWLQNTPELGVEFRLRSPVRHAARAVLQRHPLASSADVRGGQRPNLLIHGTTMLAEQILLEVLYNGHHDASFPRIAVLDESATAYERRFVDRFPGMGGVCELAFFDFDPATPRRSYAELLPKLGDEPLTGVYLAGDVAGSLRLAAVLRDALREAAAFVPPMYVHAAESSALIGHLGGRSPRSSAPRVIGFGGESEVFSADALLQSSLDDLARAHHAVYLEELLRQGRELEQLAAGRPWGRLPEYLKDAARRQADHLEIKLLALGCASFPRSDGARDAAFAFTDDEIESAARIEHIRWMAERILYGWRYAPARDERLRRHPSLVPYEDLLHDVQELDRIAVRQIPTHLARLGREIRRDLVVALVADGGAEGLDGNFDARVDEVVARLQGEHPDRGLVLLSALGEPASRRFARRALALGAVRLRVPWPRATDVYLDELGDGAAEFLELVDEADQSFALPSGFGDGVGGSRSVVALARFLAKRATELVLVRSGADAVADGLVAEAGRSWTAERAPIELTRGGCGGVLGVGGVTRA